MIKTLSLAVALSAAAFAAAPALAAEYPPPANPGKVPAASKKGRKLVVCKRGCRYKTIGAAIKRATGRDLIVVRPGTYREGVQILGRRYDGLRIVGDPKNPRRVRLDGKGVRGAGGQNAFFVNAADGVTIRGFYARNYKANCFFVVNADGYTLDRLVAERCGVYGIYAFNSKGGTMSNSEAYYNNDSGFYIGQTPPQKGRKKRSFVTNVKSYLNVLGFSGTNMRYVTIRRSQFFNNGVGIVPNALRTEKYPPPEENVIADNDVFWNNFNYYRGAPFKIPTSGPAGLSAYPIGIGILLFGSQDTIVENNRIFGNWLVGFGMVQQFELAGDSDPKLREAATLRNNVVRNNRFGLGGKDLNGRDLAYDGSGTGNCFQGNALTSPVPYLGSQATYAPCPGPSENAIDPTVLGEAAQWIATQNPKKPETFEQFWLRHPHAPRKGVKPVERYRR